MTFKPKTIKNPLTGKEVEGEPPNLSKFQFPIIRRSFTPKPLMPDLVSIQPMTAPVGAIFYIDQVYSNNYNFHITIKRAGLGTTWKK
jgi:hypothetical protein